ncbi:MAG: sulfur carrier protein ThiS [Holophagaceae bacterium]|nr:sulfur carrier protein ThiS [Holophagaceae bacterium]
MQLTINGEARDIPQLDTVFALASWLQLPSFGSAIELNGKVIKKSDHRTTSIKDGDRLEIVRLVGGG